MNLIAADASMHILCIVPVLSIRVPKCPILIAMKPCRGECENFAEKMGRGAEKPFISLTNQLRPQFFLPLYVLSSSFT